MNFQTPIVVLDDNGRRGIVLSLGAHSSKVVFEEAGHKYTVWMPNEDFTIVGYVNFKYEER